MVVFENATKKEPTPTLSPLAKRHLVRKARTGRYTSRELLDSFVLALSVRRVQQVFSQAPYLNYIRARVAPSLTKRHLEALLIWAAKKLEQNAAEWIQTIFSDERGSPPTGQIALRTSGQTG